MTVGVATLMGAKGHVRRFEARGKQARFYVLSVRTDVLAQARP